MHILLPLFSIQAGIVSGLCMCLQISVSTEFSIRHIDQLQEVVCKLLCMVGNKPLSVLEVFGEG